MTLTTAQLTAHFNKITGRDIKATSYSKAKITSMIEEAIHRLIDTKSAPLADLDQYGLGFEEYGHVCPHCGINHDDNGFIIADDYEPNSDRTYRETGNMKHQYCCMGCNGEWGPEIAAAPTGETFTLAELARSLGITPKAARARYRARFNDGVSTRYIFPASDLDRVTNIIKGKGR